MPISKNITFDYNIKFKRYGVANIIAKKKQTENNESDFCVVEQSILLLV